jgi:hypothetical protein
MPARHTEKVASVARHREMRGREQRPEKFQCPLAGLGNWRRLRAFAKRGTILTTPRALTGVAP